MPNSTLAKRIIVANNIKGEPDIVLQPHQAGRLLLKVAQHQTNVCLMDTFQKTLQEQTRKVDEMRDVLDRLAVYLVYTLKPGEIDDANLTDLLNRVKNSTGEQFQEVTINFLSSAGIIFVGQ